MQNGNGSVAPLPKDIAEAWLSNYAKAVSAGDVSAVAKCFAPNGWFRDILTLTWDFRALEGTEKIKHYLSDNLGQGDITDLKLVVDDRFCPPVYHAGFRWVEAVFTFGTRIGKGRGFTRLVPGEQHGKWSAMSVCMMVEDLKGFEESGNESGIYGGHTLAWSDVLRERKAKVEADPHVLIIGAGQTGLQVAARFKQMNIPTLVIDKNERIGDNWRKRYPTLALHTIRTHHALLYSPYPTNWPTFTPRDKLADWLESYATAQDLVIWTKSTVDGRPIYHSDTGKWEVTINHDGRKAQIQPVHIVMATGTLGDPYLPSFASQSNFSGTTFHASQYQGGAQYAGKKVVLVGAGNTSIDLCQDLVFHKAAEVTMVQRSSTCVTSGDKVAEKLAHFWPEGVPVEYGDFNFGSLPLGHLKKLMIARTEAMWEEEKELHDKLRKGGLALNMGPEGQGQLLRVWERGGGYWIDQGGADLIASGDIRIKQGVQPIGFSATSLLFADGTELEADTVIFATSYSNIRDCSRKIFGDEVIDSIGSVHGLDGEGEMYGSYRPTGHPGLWFATGDFFNSRFMSKALAMQIVALRAGLRSSPELSVFANRR